MDAFAYYSIGFSALWAVAVLPRFYGLFRRHIVPRFHSNIAKLRYQRIQGFTRLHFFNGYTGLELFLLLLYIGGNGAAVAMQATRGATIASSTVLASTINLIPLLLGGRTNRIADVIGVSRPSYYVAHYWMGRIAVVEALVHAVFGSISAAQRHAFDPIAISGCIAAASFLALLILSVPYARRKLGGAFRGVHRILYVAGMTGLVWHVLLVQSYLHEVLVFVACGLWLLSHVYRVFARWRAVTVMEKWTDEDEHVTRLWLRTQRPVSTFPGSYFYIYLPGSYFNYDLLRSSAVMMLWSDAKQTVTGKTTDFHILAGQQSRYLRMLGTIKAGDRVLLDGPYGQDLRLHEYETVILTAKGMGIVSVLPMALHLAARKNHDDSIRSQFDSNSDPTIGLATDLNTAPVFRDSTRRVDLLWRLEHNDQELWVADQLRALQDLDPRGLMLLVWCIYPSERRKNPPFEEHPHWSAVYPKPDQTVAEAEVPFSFEKSLSHEVLLPGKCIVVACGDRLFTDERRASVIRNTSKSWPIEFVEAEYRPSYGANKPSSRSPAAPTMRLRRRARRPERPESYDDNVRLHVV
ncbi:hypothetical protein BR93DRAFT_956577 [Coniochaeta sp. PMI_546]|nr:hypothetical protein BR93DRAFT_956577 [Coniochaeta sp. PMI_546]